MNIFSGFKETLFEIVCKPLRNRMQTASESNANPFRIQCKSFQGPMQAPSESNANPFGIQCKSLQNPRQILADPMQNRQQSLNIIHNPWKLDEHWPNTYKKTSRQYKAMHQSMTPGHKTNEHCTITWKANDENR